MPPPRCTDPHGIACASQPTRRMKGRKCDVWVCSNCYEIAYPEPAESAEDDPMNIKTRVLAYALYCPGHTVHECADETGINRSSVSSAAATLRNEGLMQPADGTGEMYLTNAGIEAALKLDIAPPAAPAPAVDHQGERPVSADVATKEDGDTVRTSALDVANAEIEVWRVENAKLTDELATLRTVLGDYGLSTANLDDLRSELENVSAALKAVLADQAAMKRLHAAPAVRLEWAAWDTDDGPLCTRLQVHFGAFRAYIAEITSDHGFTAKLFYSDAMDGESLRITGFDLGKVTALLAQNIAFAGLTMPPVPALPEKVT